MVGLDIPESLDVGRVFGPTGQESLAQGLPWETRSNDEP
jgi:hypothetical protein